VTGDIYQNGEYVRKNPTWHREDASWKADLVCRILGAHDITPDTVCEVGCGSGAILESLSVKFPRAEFYGYDISKDAAASWRRDISNVHLANESPLSLPRRYDVCLMLDVFEHIEDPFAFLRASSILSDIFVFHIPLDISVLGILFGDGLMRARRQTGHLHFYTRNLALATLREAGFVVRDCQYTDASHTQHARTLKTRIANLPRKVFAALNKDASARVLGGQTLLVLASPEASLRSKDETA
jgi:hypothetical protein